MIDVIEAYELILYPSVASSMKPNYLDFELKLTLFEFRKSKYFKNIVFSL